MEEAGKAGRGKVITDSHEKFMADYDELADAIRKVTGMDMGSDDSEVLEFAPEGSDDVIEFAPNGNDDVIEFAPEDSNDD